MSQVAYRPGTDGTWANRSATAEILGISMAGLMLLQRDRVLPPDCAACGRIRWRLAELEARRDELRAYLRDTYPNNSARLFDSTT